MPKSLAAAKLKKGEVMTSEVEKGMLALKWMDKRQVTMLSTIHGDSMVPKRRRSRLVAGGTEEVLKPEMVEQYNMYMGGVDKADQLLSYYGFSHHTVKWWRRAFFHLFDTAIVNAYILYRMSTHPGRKLDHMNFRIELAKSLLSSPHGATLSGQSSSMCQRESITASVRLRGGEGNVPPRTNAGSASYLCV